MSDALTIQACERKFGESECPLHPGQDVGFYCEECSVLVCSQCVTDQHKGHNFDQLGDIVNRKLNDVGSLIKKFNKLYIPNTDQSITEIRNRKVKLQNRKTVLLQHITESFETFCKKLEIARKTLEDEVNSMLEDQCEQLNKKEEKLVNLTEKSDLKLKELDRICDKGTLVEKYDAIQSLQKDEEEAAALHKMPEINTPRVGFLEIARTMLQSFHNMTKQLPSKSLKLAQSIFNVTSFDNRSPYYYALAPVTKDKSWCGVKRYDKNDNRYYETNKLCIINKQGSVEQELQTNASILRLCLHPITGVLYGTFNDKSICTIDPTTGVTATVVTCSNQPFSFSVTPDGDIIEGEYPDFLLPSHLYRYSSNGQLIHQSKGKYKSWDISYSDINDHVAIASDEDGVTIMDGTLTNVIHTHNGFCYTVVYDKNGNLVIGDSLKNSIHILDGKTFSNIRTFTHSQMSRPMNIRLYDNSMWVECVDHSKIVHVNISVSHDCDIRTQTVNKK